MAFVYWIHLFEHQNIFTEGYVGFTSTSVKRRFASHMSDSRAGEKRRVHNALRKYGDKIIVSVIYEGDIEECLELEKFYRPSENLGWNHGVGGASPQIGVAHSEETRLKISATKRANTKPISEATRQRISEAGLGRKYSSTSRLKMSESARQRVRNPWTNSRANKETWINADEIYKIYLETSNLTKMANEFSTHPSKFISIFEKFQTGWIPTEDISWLEFKQSFENALSGEKREGNSLYMN